jgi:hypothetical protein
LKTYKVCRDGKKSFIDENLVGLVRSACIPVVASCLFEEHYITTQVLFLLLIHLYWFHHMELGEFGDIGVRDDIAIYIAPLFLLENDLPFVPVVHPYFIKAGSIVADEYKLVPAALCEWHDYGHFVFAFHGNGCFLEKNEPIVGINIFEAIYLFAYQIVMTTLLADYILCAGGKGKAGKGCKEPQDMRTLHNRFYKGLGFHCKDNSVCFISLDNWIKHSGN